MPEQTPVRVWIAPGAAAADDASTWSWADITDQVRRSPPVTVEYGRDDEWDDVDPSKCKITLDNATGDFSELNPAGQWFGLLGADTPVRVALRRGADDFNDRTELSDWGMAGSGQEWTDGSGGPATGAVNSGVAYHTMPAAGDTRFSLLDVELRNVSITFRASTLDTIAGASVTTTAIARWAGSGTDFVSARATINPSGSVDLSLGQVVAGVGAALATATGISGVSYASGDLIWIRLDVRGSWAAMMVYEDGQEPPGWQVETDELAVLDAGAVGIRTVRTVGNTNPNQTMRYHEFYADVDRFGGYASNWSPKTSHRDADQTVSITATGQLGRTSPALATLPELSPLRRTLSADPDLVAYWPAEDGSTAGKIASALPGHRPGTISGTVSFDDIDALDQLVSFLPPVKSANFRYGTPSLANLEAGGRIDVVLPAAATAATVAEQSLYLLARLDDGVASANITVLEWDTPGGTFAKWQMIYVLSPINMIIRAWTAAGVSTDVITAGSGFIGLLDVVVSLWQDGGTIRAGMFTNGLGGHTFTGSVAGTLAGVTHVAVNANRVTYSDDLFPVGHLAVRAANTPPTAVTDDQFDDYGSGSNSARVGFRNEAAHLRLARLTAEDGVRLLTTPISADDETAVQRMFSQGVGRSADLYRTAAAADGGILHEAPFALAFRPLRTLYAQDVALQLAYAGDLGAPPAPDLSQATYRNQVTIERTEGSEVTVQTTAVTSGLELARPEKVELELASDDQVEPHAEWRLAQRSLRTPRWPSVDLVLAAIPDRVDEWLSVDVGDRVQLTGVRTVAGAGTIEAIVQGWTEVLGSVTPLWRVSLQLAPGDILSHVGVYDVARYDSASSSLTSDVTTSATSFQVTTTDPTDLWTTGAGLGIQLIIGGEVLTVDTISGATSPQTFSSVTRAVNGVTKAHAAGAGVQLADPARYAL